MQEILTIQVNIAETFAVKGKTAEVAVVTFDGYCDCENFKGKILPGGVDCQKECYPQARRLSARYILEGTDKEEKACRIFIENKGEVNKNGMVETTIPEIITDSTCLSWMEQARLFGTITPREAGITIHIFSD